MRTDVECVICGEPSAPIVCTDVHHEPRRGQRWTAREPVCLDCAGRNLYAETDRRAPKLAHWLHSDSWWKDAEPQPCAHCGVPTIIRPDKRRARVHCSDRCRAAYARARKREREAVTEHECQVCGDLMSGRADRKFCSPACRQKAHRQRKAEVTPELADRWREFVGEAAKVPGSGFKVNGKH